MPRRPAFDLTTLRKLAPRAARFDHWDPATPGLALRVSPSGVKVFYWVRRVGRRVERVRLGALEEFERIGDVRALAQQQTALKTGGVDPAEHRRAQRAELTLGELWTAWVAHPSKRKGQTWGEVNWREVNRWEKYLAAWGGRRLSGVTAAEVTALLERIASGGSPVQANRVRALVRAVFNYAVSLGLAGANPVSRTTPRSREQPRARHLSAAELKRFLAALDAQESGDLRDWCRLLLFTGARSHTVYAMRWQDVDLNERVWTIPGEAMKAGRTLVVPLAPVVVDLLATRHRVRQVGSLWVFPSRRRGEHLTDLRELFNDLRDAAALKDLTPHDLRRTFASYAQAAGVPLEVIAGALGHTPVGGVTAIYAKVQPEHVRLAVERAVATMLAVAEGPDGGATVLAAVVPAWAREAT